MIKEEPLISVVMAVYNGEKYLNSAIRSVINQTFKNFEFIIIDDCSNDKTYTIIKKFNDNRIIYKKNDINIGQTPSLNKGVILSKGKYIARIDADDLFIENKLELQYNFLENNPQFSGCGTQCKSIDENGKIYSNRLFPANEKDLVFRSFFQSPINHVSVMIRKNDLIDVGIYNEKFPICADFELWSRMIIKGYRFVNLNENLTMWRIVKNSLSFSNKSGQAGKETSLIIQKNLDKILKINLSFNECRNIVMMLWPAERLSIHSLIESYLNLKNISKTFYNNKVPLNKKLFIDKILIKSLIKRFAFKLKNNEKYNIYKDFKKIILRFVLRPKLVFYYFTCFLIAVLFNQKLLNKIKLITSS